MSETLSQVTREQASTAVTRGDIAEQERILEDFKGEDDFSPEDEAVLNELAGELEAQRLAKEAGHHAVLAQLRKDEGRSREGNDWQTPKA